jgi:hypothetical protein
LTVFASGHNAICAKDAAGNGNSLLNSVPTIQHLPMQRLKQSRNPLTHFAKNHFAKNHFAAALAPVGTLAYQMATCVE